MPVDAEDQGGFNGLATFPDGNLVVTGHVDGKGERVPVVRYVTPGTGKYRSHFSSCPESAEWRKR